MPDPSKLIATCRALIFKPFGIKLSSQRPNNTKRNLAEVSHFISNPASSYRLSAVICTEKSIFGRVQGYS